METHDCSRINPPHQGSESHDQQSACRESDEVSIVIIDDTAKNSASDITSRPNFDEDSKPGQLALRLSPLAEHCKNVATSLSVTVPIFQGTFSTATASSRLGATSFRER